MDYNPLSPEVQANPFPYYAFLRHSHPAAWLEPLQAWAISRYRDVDQAIKSPQIFSSAKWLSVSIGDLNPVPEVPWMIETDPPDHSRLRKLVSKGFTPRMVSRLEPRIRTIARELLEPLRAKREFDFMREFAGVLPVIVIAEMLGVEPERRADFKRWSDDIVRGTNRPNDETVRNEIKRSNAELRAYLQKTIAQRRVEPRDDLLTALVRAEEDQQTLTADEVLAMAALVLAAGNETTTNLLGNTVLALLIRPADFAAVRNDRGLVPRLLEEVLRYDSPLQMVFRHTTKEVVIGDATIPANAPVLVLLGSANRDEQQFPDPDRFDMQRDTTGHLAFGFATHYCLGAELARLEARVGLEELLFSCPPFTGDPGRCHRVGSLFIRGLESLPIRFEG
jgi:cytochrome P450